MAEESSNPLTYTHKPLPVAEEIDTYPQGLGGWMILVCFSVIISFLGSLRDIVDPPPGFGFNNLSLLMHSDNPKLRQAFYFVLIYEIMAIVYLILCSFLVALLFSKNKKFPALFIFSLIADAIVLFGAFFWATPMAEILRENIYQLLGVGLLIILPRVCMISYLLRARRVKATFVNSW